MKKYAIQVRNGDGTPVETIYRVLRVESFGNFAPMFCLYRNDKRVGGVT